MALITILCKLLLGEGMPHDAAVCIPSEPSMQLWTTHVALNKYLFLYCTKYIWSNIWHPANHLHSTGYFLSETTIPYVSPDDTADHLNIHNPRAMDPHTTGGYSIFDLDFIACCNHVKNLIGSTNLLNSLKTWSGSLRCLHETKNLLQVDCNPLIDIPLTQFWREDSVLKVPYVLFPNFCASNLLRIALLKRCPWMYTYIPAFVCSCPHLFVIWIFKLGRNIY